MGRGGGWFCVPPARLRVSAVPANTLNKIKAAAPVTLILRMHLVHGECVARAVADDTAFAD
jgi:hypothetical protein